MSCLSALRSALLILVAANLPVSVLGAQDAAAAELRRKYAAAVGTPQAFDSIRSIRVVAAVEIPAQHMAYEDDRMSDTRGRWSSRNLLTGEAMVFDGTDVWSASRTMGTRKLTSSERAMVASGGNWFAQFRPIEAPSTARAAGSTTFAGAPATALEITSPDGSTVTEFYDPATGLLRGSRSTTQTAMGPISSETVIEAFEQFGPLKIPARFSVTAAGFEVRMRVHTVVFNRATDKAFAVPTIEGPATAPGGQGRGRPRP